MRQHQLTDGASECNAKSRDHHSGAVNGDTLAIAIGSCDCIADGRADGDPNPDPDPDC